MRTKRLAVLLGPTALALILACGNGTPKYYLQSAAYPTNVQACRALNKFDRYRYKFEFRITSPMPEGPIDTTKVGTPPFAAAPDSPTIELAQQHEGAIVNPDSIDLVMKTPGLPDQAMRWVKGDQWLDFDGDWRLIDDPAPYNYSPALVCHSIMAGLQLTGIISTPEKVNGLDTSHYHLEDVALLTGSYLFNAGSDMGRLLQRYAVDVWLTEDGWPGRLEAESQGTYPSGRELFMELSLEISDVNSEDVAVERPPTGAPGP